MVGRRRVGDVDIERCVCEGNAYGAGCYERWVIGSVRHFVRRARLLFATNQIPVKTAQLFWLASGSGKNSVFPMISKTYFEVHVHCRINSNISLRVLFE